MLCLLLIVFFVFSFLCNFLRGVAPYYEVFFSIGKTLSSWGGWNRVFLRKQVDTSIELMRLEFFLFILELHKRV